MNLKFVTTVALLACFGFAEQALSLNPRDLDQLKTTGGCPRCDFSGANLTEFNLTGVNLRDANLKGATLSNVNLSKADLTGANLQGAILNSANLSRTSLTGANLKSASLENADLSYAGLLSANLEGANLKGANLQFANFRGAHFRLTIMPAGVITSDKPYWWSLERTASRECDKFKPEQTPGTTCYGQ